MKESKHLTNASDYMSKAVAPTAGNYFFDKALSEFAAGMRKTYSAPIKGNIEYYPNGPGHAIPGEFVATLEFSMYLATPMEGDQGPGKPGERREFEEFTWLRTLSASGKDLAELKQSIVKTMATIDKHVSFIRRAVTLERNLPRDTV
jgi:hypothetical protein